VFGWAYIFSCELYDDAQHCSQEHKYQDAEYVNHHDLRFLLTWLRTRTVKSFQISLDMDSHLKTIGPFYTVQTVPMAFMAGLLYQLSYFLVSILTNSLTLAHAFTEHVEIPSPELLCNDCM
jgi:type III secretory pathway component EscR